MEAMEKMSLSKATQIPIRWETKKVKGHVRLYIHAK